MVPDAAPGFKIQLSADHLGAALGALFLIAGHPHHVRFPVTATRADAGAAGPGGPVAAHPSGPLPATATCTATTPTTASTSSKSTTHEIYLLIQDTL